MQTRLAYVEPIRKEEFLHVNRGWLTGGTNAVISADLLDHVGEPYGCLTGRVTHTRQVLTARGGGGLYQNV